MNSAGSVSDELSSEILLGILYYIQHKSTTERIALKDLLIKVHDVLQELTKEERATRHQRMARDLCNIPA